MAYQPWIKFQIIHFSISIVFVYKQLNVKTVQFKVKTLLFKKTQNSINTLFSSIKKILFQAVQFSIRKQFQCQKQFYLKPFSFAKVQSLVVSDLQIGPYQVLILLARVDLEAMA